nr:zinc finger protein 646-like isoform X1 [Ipomoea batatas]
MEFGSGSNKMKVQNKKRKSRRNKLKFLGWGSKPLIEFLDSIGKESMQYSQGEIDAIMKKKFGSGSNKMKVQNKKRKSRRNKLEFLVWGSKPLIEFLDSIGKESRQYSQGEVDAIMKKLSIISKKVDEDDEHEDGNNWVNLNFTVREPTPFSVGKQQQQLRIDGNNTKNHLRPNTSRVMTKNIRGKAKAIRRRKIKKRQLLEVPPKSSH